MKPSPEVSPALPVLWNLSCIENPAPPSKSVITNHWQQWTAMGGHGCFRLQSKWWLEVPCILCLWWDEYLGQTQDSLVAARKYRKGFVNLKNGRCQKQHRKVREIWNLVSWSKADIVFSETDKGLCEFMPFIPFFFYVISFPLCTEVCWQETRMGKQHTPIHTHGVGVVHCFPMCLLNS